MSNITNSSPVVTEDKLKDFYEDIKPFLGCPAYVTQEGDAEYYSTDEKVIGRWIDNKPLYQKTFKIGALTNYTSDWTQTTNIAIGASVDEFVCSYGVLYSTNKEWCAPIPYSVNNDIFVIPSLFPNAAPSNSNTVCLAYLGNLGWVTDSYITVQYTKTTDSAITTIEQKPTHFSTDEQVVGTWINGKPLYQKTFTGTFSGIIDKTKKLIDVGTIDNVSMAVQLWGSSYGIIFPSAWDNTYYIRILNVNGIIRVVTNYAEINDKNYYVTAQYIKNTD